MQQDSLAGTVDRYKQASGSVTELSSELARLTEELENTKAQMDERGSSMTDAGPVVKIKKALAQLKADIVAMEVRQGVVQHTLLVARQQTKSAQVAEMHSRP